MIEWLCLTIALAALVFVARASYLRIKALTAQSATPVWSPPTLWSLCYGLFAGEAHEEEERLAIVCLLTSCTAILAIGSLLLFGLFGILK